LLRIVLEMCHTIIILFEVELFAIKELQPRTLLVPEKLRNLVGFWCESIANYAVTADVPRERTLRRMPI
jgi:hypothetical protein